MNKIGVQSNAALPPTFLRNIFYIVNIFFRIVLQKLKIGSREYASIFHIAENIVSFSTCISCIL